MIELSVFDLGSVGCLGYMMMMKSGFVQYLEIQRRKRQFRTSTSSSSRGWEVLLSILKEEVNFVPLSLRQI